MRFTEICLVYYNDIFTLTFLHQISMCLYSRSECILSFSAVAAMVAAKYNEPLPSELIGVLIMKMLMKYSYPPMLSEILITSRHTWET